MHPCDAPQDEPDEHLRFAAYLSELAQAADADQPVLVTKVLSDPDRAMVHSAVLRHLDRRASDLHLGPAFEPWTEAMTRATVRRVCVIGVVGLPGLRLTRVCTYETFPAARRLGDHAFVNWPGSGGFRHRCKA